MRLCFLFRKKRRWTERTAWVVLWTKSFTRDVCLKPSGWMHQILISEVCNSSLRHVTLTDRDHAQLRKQIGGAASAHITEQNRWRNHRWRKCELSRRSHPRRWTCSCELHEAPNTLTPNIWRKCMYLFQVSDRRWTAVKSLNLNGWLLLSFRKLCPVIRWESLFGRPV